MVTFGALRVSLVGSFEGSRRDRLGASLLQGERELGLLPVIELVHCGLLRGHIYP